MSLHRLIILPALLLEVTAFAQAPAPTQPAAAPQLSRHDQSAAMLSDALKDKNPDTRKAAVQAMSLVCLKEPYLSQVKSMLEDKDVEVRLATITSLVDLKNKSTVGTLETALDDEVPEVSFTAAKALWLLHDPAGEQELLAVLEGDSKASSNFISKQKRDTLRMFHTPRVLFLFAVRQGMGFVPLPGFGEGVGSMQALLTDPGISGRATAALLLGKDKSAAVLDALKDGLLDKDWSVRAAAVHSLSLRDDPALKETLEPLLDDEKEPVRLRAAAGFLRLSAIQQQQAQKKPVKRK